MNHVSQGISIFFAFSDHSCYCVPRIPVILHGFDNFNDGVDVLNIFLDVLGLQFVNILFLLEFFNSVILIFFNLIKFFPSNLFKSFLLLMLGFFIFRKVFCNGLIKCGIFLFWTILKFYIIVWRKLKILFLFALFFLLCLLLKQVALVLLF